MALRGRVACEGGFSCLNTVLEAWRVDAGGRFNHPLDPKRHLAAPDFLAWGRAWTDEEELYGSVRWSPAARPMPPAAAHRT